MPVAKLSREFYEKFGDKLTDELVNCLNSIETGYRGELRDLFDAHFGRFEEKLEHRLAETTAQLRTEFRDEIARLREEVHDEIAQLREQVHDESAGLRTETGDRIGGLRSEIRDQMASLQSEIRDEMANLRVEVHAVKGDLMKWSFVFWLPVVLALLGLYVKG